MFLGARNGVHHLTDVDPILPIIQFIHLLNYSGVLEIGLLTNTNCAAKLLPKKNPTVNHTKLFIPATVPLLKMDLCWCMNLIQK
jgi:hypothetical protein